MAYLKNENNEIIVDAILTKFGREKLSKEGNLGITKFALADDEVDYALYNVNHPNGELYYDIAIRELPILEALPGNDVSLRYLLFTSQNPNVSSITQLNVSYPIEFTNGISQLSTYTFTPQLYPIPSSEQLSKIYFVAEISDVVGSVFELVGLQEQKGQYVETNERLNAQVQYSKSETQYKKYAVGQYFQFKLKSRPRFDRVYPVIVTAFGPVSAVPYKFTIKVLGNNQQQVSVAVD